MDHGQYRSGETGKVSQGQPTLLMLRCFGNLVIDPEGTSVDQNGSKINRFRYLFHRKDLPAQSRSSFLLSQINIGDPIVVSDELGHFALANGFVTDLQPDALFVNVDRRLHGARTRQSGFDPVNNQSFTGIVEIRGNSTPRASSELDTQIQPTVTYRIDKDEFKSGMAIARNNIIQLFTKSGDSKRRELIVRGRAPTFRHPRQGTQYPYFEKHRDGLNIDQRKAVEKVLTGIQSIRTGVDYSGGLCLGAGNAWNWQDHHYCAHHSCSCGEWEKCAFDVIHAHCCRQYPS